MRLPDYSSSPDPFVEALSANRMTMNRGWSPVYLAPRQLRGSPFTMLGLASAAPQRVTRGQWAGEDASAPRKYRRGPSRVRCGHHLCNGVWLPFRSSLRHTARAIASESKAFCSLQDGHAEGTSAPCCQSFSHVVN